MKFNTLKDARWELTVGSEHRTKEGTYYGALIMFHTEIKHKRYQIIYADHSYPLTWYFEEEIEDATEEEVVEWVRKRFIPEGDYQALFENVFLGGLLKNF